MKHFIFILLIGFFSLNLQSQNIHQAIHKGMICDSLLWTSTDYPVRLKNDVTELEKTLSDQLTLYPEDLEKNAEITYRFTVTCAGIHTHSSLASHKGNIKGLSDRILKILNVNCSFIPAMNSDQPVNSFYELGIKFRKGKIPVILQDDL